MVAPGLVSDALDWGLLALLLSGEAAVAVLFSEEVLEPDC